MIAARILIVEDDRIVARDIQHQLSRMGHVVVGTSASGEDAVRQACSQQPDLVLMDIRLEGEMDGIEAARRIRDAHRIPIVFLTAYANDEVVHRASLTEPFGYLLKPFEEPQMRTVIQMALYKHASDTRLRLSERRLHTLISGMPQLVWRAQGAGGWTWASPQWAAFTGQDRAASLGWGWLEAVHPEDRARVREAWRLAESRGTLSIDHRILGRADRRYRWFQTRAAPVRGADGTIGEWLGTSTDIDEMRMLQDRQQVLLDELQHRTRNLMGVVSVLARRTAAASEDLDAFVASFDDRLAALSRANNLLSKMADGQRIAFDVLLRQELDALGVTDDAGICVALEGDPDIPLRSSTVQILALALHELGTNAVKYGALAGVAGRRLSVSWRIDATGTPRCLVVQWRESGVPMDEPCGTGYGRELIERALPYQLGASTCYACTPDGVVCTIRLPVSAHEGD